MNNVAVEKSGHIGKDHRASVKGILNGNSEKSTKATGISNGVANGDALGPGSATKHASGPEGVDGLQNGEAQTNGFH